MINLYRIIFERIFLTALCFGNNINCMIFKKLILIEEKFTADWRFRKHFIIVWKIFSDIIFPRDHILNSFPFASFRKDFIEKRKKKELEMKVLKIILDSNQLLLLSARFVRELAPLFRFPSALTLFLLFSSPLAMDLLNYVWLTVKVHSTGEIGVGISARTTFGSKRIGFVLKLGLEKRRNENSLTFSCLMQVQLQEEYKRPWIIIFFGW